MLTFVQLAFGGTLTALIASAGFAVVRLLVHDLSEARADCRVHVGPLPNEEKIGWEAAAYLALEAQEQREASRVAPRRLGFPRPGSWWPCQ